MKILCFLSYFLLSANLWAINPPSNNAPSNSAINQATSVTLDWSAIANNVGYIYEIDTTPNFNSVLFETGTTGTNSSQAIVVDLYFGTTYYWRVATIGPVDTSVWSTVTNFTTQDDLANSAPLDLAINQATTVTIDWAAMPGNQGYIYEIDTTPSFNSSFYMLGNSATNSSEAILSDLQFNTTYYWRAAIKNNVDTSGWGATWSFTTLNNINNSAPTNAATNLGTNVTLDWAAMTGNSGYIYEIDTTPSFNSPLYMTNSSPVNSSQVGLANLRFGTTYYWRAAVKNAVDTSDWSATWSFSTLASIANSSPSNGASNQNTNLLIDWASMSGNSGYLYEVDTTPNFNSPFLISNATVTNSSIASLSNLSFGTTYYWHAAVKNAVDTSDWSTTWSFSTKNTVLNFSPNNAVTSQPTSLTLDWSSVTGNQGYLYEIDSTPNFNSPIHQRAGTAMNISQVDVADLYFGTTYYWRAAVLNNVDTSEWSTTYSFSTTNGVFNLSPSDQSTGVALNPTLDWFFMTGNQGYLYQVDTSLDFNSPLLIDSSTAVDISQETISGLLYGTTYYWRVAITNNVDTSAWNLPFQFTTLYQLSVAPLLLSPSDASIGISVTMPLSLVWDSIATATSYEMQYSTDSTFLTGVNSSFHSALTTDISGLTDTTTYFWRVRASDGAGFSPWSSIWDFTTETLTNTASLEASDPIRLFPNPVSDYLTLELPSDKKYQLDLIDAKGQLLEQRAIENRSSLQYDLTAFPKGIYFLRITSKDEVRTIPFIKK